MSHEDVLKVLGDIAAENAERGVRAAWLHGRLMAADLRDAGITVDCTPSSCGCASAADALLALAAMLFHLRP